MPVSWHTRQSSRPNSVCGIGGAPPALGGALVGDGAAAGALVGDGTAAEAAVGEGAAGALVGTAVAGLSVAVAAAAGVGAAPSVTLGLWQFVQMSIVNDLWLAGNGRTLPAL